ncbi:hypothetical protein [Streptomyces sp. NPDC056512]|uniref:hypothetical protein n=1 Tax=Streptomyces sp. NPDC056512 TaxID=3345846 RepID=UPI0036BDB1A7
MREVHLSRGQRLDADDADLVAAAVGLLGADHGDVRVGGLDSVERVELGKEGGAVLLDRKEAQDAASVQVVGVVGDGVQGVGGDDLAADVADGSPVPCCAPAG